jgi:predicted alpha/beta hydrolase family esterase
MNLTGRSRSYLILHGIGNDRPPDHWEFQLGDELARGGHEVRYAALPDPHFPSLDGWPAVLAEELNALTGHQRTVPGDDRPTG